MKSIGADVLRCIADYLTVLETYHCQMAHKGFHKAVNLHSKCRLVLKQHLAPRVTDPERFLGWMCVNEFVLAGPFLKRMVRGTDTERINLHLLHRKHTHPFTAMTRRQLYLALQQAGFHNLMRTVRPHDWNGPLVFEDYVNSKKVQKVILLLARTGGFKELLHHHGVVFDGNKVKFPLQQTHRAH